MRPTRQEMAAEVRRTRRYLRMGQRTFAGVFGVPLPTLRHWERGDRRPSGAARVLLVLIAANPRPVLLAVRKTRQWRPWMLARFHQTRSWRALPGTAVYMG